MVHKVREKFQAESSIVLVINNHALLKYSRADFHVFRIERDVRDQFTELFNKRIVIKLLS